MLEGQRTRIEHAAGPPWPLLEVQVVEAADSITYDTHDADDALELELITLDELLIRPLWAAAADRVRGRYAALTGIELRRAVLHELIDWQVSDLLARAGARLADAAIRSSEGGPARCSDRRARRRVGRTKTRSGTVLARARVSAS